MEGCRKLGGIDAAGQPERPRLLAARRGGDRIAPGRGEDEQPGTGVMRVRIEARQPLGHEVVGHTLHGLAAQPHGARDMRDRERHRRHVHRAQDLPARGSEPDIAHQPVARQEQRAVETERLEDDRRDRAPLPQHDMTLSY